MQLKSLSDSGLGISREELAKTFEPFVASSMGAHDPKWRTEIERRQRAIFRRYLKRVFFGWLPSTQRGENEVIAEYSKAWLASEYNNYSLAAPLTRISPWEWGEERMFASDIGATRFRQILLARVIERVEPKNVLEVGCGNGINLMLLACRFPQIELTGVELTAEGYRAATELQKLQQLPAAIQEYAPLPLTDPAGFRKVRFLQGNAVDLRLPDNGFDLVTTVLALEQMERVRHRALVEIARVARRNTFMIEPFQDVNDRGWPRTNIIRRDYFRGAIADLPRYGLDPVLALDDFPQEAFLKACAVLSQKRG
jgi:SAM-dependent methyltransferase